MRLTQILTLRLAHSLTKSLTETYTLTLRLIDLGMSLTKSGCAFIYLILFHLASSWIELDRSDRLDGKGREFTFKLARVR